MQGEGAVSEVITVCSWETSRLTAAASNKNNNRGLALCTGPAREREGLHSLFPLRRGAILPLLINIAMLVFSIRLNGNFGWFVRPGLTEETKL